MAIKTSALPRGRPRRLTLARVLDAAIRVVSSRGVKAMTMEAVARELGVGTMTLYGYVDSRDDLIDRAVTHLLAGAPPVPRGSGKGWVSATVSHCLAARRWIADRPALLALSAERPHLSDGIASRYASEVEGLMRAGFSMQDAALVRQAISVQLFGQMQWEEVRRAAERSGLAASNRARGLGGRVPPLTDSSRKLVESMDPEKLYETSLRALLRGFESMLAAGNR